MRRNKRPISIVVIALAVITVTAVELIGASRAEKTEGSLVLAAGVLAGITGALVLRHLAAFRSKRDGSSEKWPWVLAVLVGIIAAVGNRLSSLGAIAFASLMGAFLISMAILYRNQSNDQGVASPEPQEEANQ